MSFYESNIKFQMKSKDSKEKVLSQKGTTKLEQDKTVDVHEDDVDLGIVKKLIDYLLSLCDLPPTWSVFITILIALCINLSDGAGDVGLALLLYQRGKYTEAMVIFAIDYAACFLTSIHYIMVAVSSNRSVTRIVVETLLLFFLHPFAPSITMALWMLARQAGNQEIERHFHFLTKLTVTITSMFEAPLQVIATTSLALTGQIDTPWTTDQTICDSFGNCLSLGYFSVFVYSISWLALLKASLDAFSGCDTFSVFVFLITTIVFRLLCLIGMYTCSTIWSLVILIPLLITSCVVAARNTENQSGINLFTTIFCSTFLTTVIPEDPSLKEQKTKGSQIDRNTLISISSLTSFVQLVILFIGVLFTYFLVNSSALRTNPKLKLDGDQLTFLVKYLVSPLFFISLVATAWFFFINRKPKTNKRLQIITNLFILCLFLSVLLFNLFSLPGSSATGCVSNECSSDILYLGTRSFQLPSFTPIAISSCSPMHHPVHGIRQDGVFTGLAYAVSGLVGGRVITCGGYDDTLGIPWGEEHPLSSCHSLEAGKWTAEASMRHEREYAAASVVPATGAMVVTGGMNGKASYLSSTEIFKAGGWVAGPDTPVKIAHHCQVTVNQSVIITGGFNADIYLNTTYKFANNTWTRLPDMKEAREGHSCEEYMGEVVVMGGELKTVEILNMTSMQWRRGPDLPRRVSWGFSTVYENTLYLVDSGWDGSGIVFSLSSDGARWKLVENIGFTRPVRQVFPAPRVTGDMLGCAEI